MGRFTASQIALIVFGCGLILSAVFLDRISRAWEDYLYPDAVHWQQMRIVPSKKQKIVVPGEDVLVVKQTGALLTLFLRADDKLTPQAMVRDLCRRDGCVRSAMEDDGDDRAVATYKLRGASMQIVLMRLAGGALWVEYKGPPDGMAAFDNVIDSVSLQLAERRAALPD